MADWAQSGGEQGGPRLAEALPVEAPALGALQSIGSLRTRQCVSIEGVLTSLTYDMNVAKPRLVGRLSDGTGTVELVWLGRRRIAGVEAGAHLRAHGRVSDSPRSLLIFNPDYELVGDKR